MNATTGALCAAVLATLAPTLATAADNPHGPLFYSAQSAAEGALNDALEENPKREWAGVIYRCGDVFSYSRPQQGDEMSFRIEVRIPKGCALAGIYHTHPKWTVDADTFSPEDRLVAKRLRVPSWIAVTRTGEIRLHVPANAPDPRTYAAKRPDSAQ